jgi:uncharacterized protein YndB with AHSA1/START domain
MVLDDGVADIRRSRTIPAPATAVWDVLADFGTISSWAGDVDHSCILNHGPDGEMLGATRRAQMGRMALVERITVFNPPTAVGYDVEGLPKLLGHVANRWTLRPAGKATEVTITSTVEIGRNPLARTAELVIGRGMAKTSDSLLADLARRLENPHA